MTGGITINNPAPSMEALIACGECLAHEMHQPPPDRELAEDFFRALLHRPQREGGKELWPCFGLGIITAVELRNCTIARFATWLSHTNGVPEPFVETWGSSEIEQLFDSALLGHRASESAG